MSGEGNCYFLQTQLNTLIPKILSEISGFNGDSGNRAVFGKKDNFKRNSG
jgi:hypothetical protein